MCKTCYQNYSCGRVAHRGSVKTMPALVPQKPLLPPPAEAMPQQPPPRQDEDVGEDDQENEDTDEDDDQGEPDVDVDVDVDDEDADVDVDVDVDDGGDVDVDVDVDESTDELSHAASAKKQNLVFSECYECGKKCSTKSTLDDGCDVAVCSESCLEKIKATEIGIDTSAIRRQAEKAKKAAEKAKKAAEKATEKASDIIRGARKKPETGTQTPTTTPQGQQNQPLTTQASSGQEGGRQSRLPPLQTQDPRKDDGAIVRPPARQTATPAQSRTGTTERVIPPLETVSTPSMGEIQRALDMWVEHNQRLWQSHVTWMREAMVARVDLAQAPDDRRARVQQKVDAALDLLQENRSAIADLTVGTFVGDAAIGKRLGDLLAQHNDLFFAVLDETLKLEQLPPMNVITDGVFGNDLKERPITAVNIVSRLSGLKKPQVTPYKAMLDSIEEFYENGDQIAEYLSSLDMQEFPKETVEQAFNVHLGQMLLQAIYYIDGQFMKSAQQTQASILHVRKLSDAISNGAWNIVVKANNLQTAIKASDSVQDRFLKERPEYKDDYTV